MNQKGRIENSLRNSTVNVVAYVIEIFLGLLVRTVFIRTLSAEYLGVGGLFTNVLTILSLAELGVGKAIIFNLYKPVAENNEELISKLLNFYKVAYRIIGVIVGLIGIILIPFLDYIIRDQSAVPNLRLIYLLFLLNSVLSYFFSYKQCIFDADQNARIIYITRLALSIIRAFAQIVILLFTHDYILYLLIQIMCTVLENVFLYHYADKKYPFLKKNNKITLTQEEKDPIIRNIKALFIYSVGGVALGGTDNIIISAFDGIISVGLLSNYSLITNSLQTLMSRITNSIYGSVGNFIAKEKSEEHELLLNKLFFAYYLMYGFCFVCLMAGLQPFIQLWAGKMYLLSYPIVFVSCLNMYIFGMMEAIWTFRSTMGLFVYGKWRPLVSAVINIVVSIILAKGYGLIGVLIGTTITRLLTNVLYDPYIVYKYGMKRSPFCFYIKWFKSLLICTADIIIVVLFNRLITFNNALITLILSVSLGAVLFAFSTWIFFRKKNEYTYVLYILFSYINKLRNVLLHRK